MARVPDVARRRFFSGSPLDTFVEQLLFFSLKIGKDQKKIYFHVRRVTFFLLKSGEDQKKRSSRQEQILAGDASTRHFQTCF